MKKPNQSGFTLMELTVAIVVMSILAAVAIPRLMRAQNRARIGAAHADLDQFRHALGLFIVDHPDYPTSDYNSVGALRAVLIDENGDAYMTLSDGVNFASFSYEYDDSVVPTSYEITVTALDNGNTTLIARPDGVFR